MTDLPQPEQTFFADPAMDRLMGVVFILAAEVQVLRDRLAVAEYLLEGRGALDRAMLDRFVPSQQQAAELAADRRAFVRHVLEPVLGHAASKSP